MNNKSIMTGYPGRWDESDEESVASIGNDIDISQLAQRDADRHGMLNYLQSREYLIPSTPPSAIEKENMVLNTCHKNLHTNDDKPLSSAIDDLFEITFIRSPESLTNTPSSDHLKRLSMMNLVDSLTMEVKKVVEKLQDIKNTLSTIQGFIINDYNEDYSGYIQNVVIIVIVDIVIVVLIVDIIVDDIIIIIIVVAIIAFD